MARYIRGHPPTGDRHRQTGAVRPAPVPVVTIDLDPASPTQLEPLGGKAPSPFVQRKRVRAVILSRSGPRAFGLAAIA